MKQFMFALVAGLLFSGLALTGCGGGGSSDDGPTPEVVSVSPVTIQYRQTNVKVTVAVKDFGQRRAVIQFGADTSTIIGTNFNISPTTHAGTISYIFSDTFSTPGTYKVDLLLYGLDGKSDGKAKQPATGDVTITVTPRPTS